MWRLYLDWGWGYIFQDVLVPVVEGVFSPSGPCGEAPRVGSSWPSRGPSLAPGASASTWIVLAETTTGIDRMQTVIIRQVDRLVLAFIASPFAKVPIKNEPFIILPHRRGLSRYFFRKIAQICANRRPDL